MPSSLITSVPVADVYAICVYVTFAYASCARATGTRHQQVSEPTAKCNSQK